jgi:hypothetical protein
MKLTKLLTPVFLSLTLGLTVFSCEKNEPQPDPADQAKPVFSQMMDIDNDGVMELVIGFDNSDVNALTNREVILHGRLVSTNTRFETDPFDIRD